MDDVSPPPPSAPFDTGAVFEEHFDYVWNSLRRLGVRDPDLEDVVHEVFLKIHQRRQDFDATRPMRPWLFGFAMRVAADYRRLARHRMEASGVDVDATDPEPFADERVERRRQRAAVEAALDTLPLERRAVLVLHDLDEVPVPAIAEALGIPLNTAYSRLRLAREELRVAIRRTQQRAGGVR
jgi:RNA polymerase sigma-70 factor (ECF subfamily)